MPAGPNNFGASINNNIIGTKAWTALGTPGTPEIGAGSGITEYVVLTNFGFTLTSSDSIVAIQAKLEVTGSGAGGAFDNSVKIVKGGTISGSDKSAGAAWGSLHTYGDLVSDLWGLTWIYTDINANNFGVALSGNIGPGVSGTLTLITGQITVAYSSPPVPLSLEGKAFDVSYATGKFTFLIPATSKVFGQTLAVGRETIQRLFNANSIEQSLNNIVNVSVNKPITSKSLEVSNAQGKFSLATILAFSGSALCQSYSSITTSTLNVQQLVGKSIDVSAASANGYTSYLYLTSKSLDVSYAPLASHATTLQFHSVVHSDSYFYAGVNEPYLKSVPLKSTIYCESYSLAEISRSFPIYSNSIDRSFSLAETSVGKKLAGSSFEYSINNKSNLSILRKLSSNSQIATLGRGYTQTLVRLTSKGLLQTSAHGNGTVNRIIESYSLEQTISRVVISNKLNKESKAISSTYSHASEIVTRLLSGIADSISIAQKSNGKVSRLFVGSSFTVSYSYGKTATKINLLSKVYSISFADASYYSNKQLHSQSNDISAPLTQLKIQQSLTSRVISTSMSRGSENVQKKLNSQSNNRSFAKAGLKSNRLFVGLAKSQSFATGKTQTKVNLQGKAVTQTLAEGNSEAIKLLSSRVECSSHIQHSEVNILRLLF